MTALGIRLSFLPFWEFELEGLQIWIFGSDWGILGWVGFFDRENLFEFCVELFLFDVLATTATTGISVDADGCSMQFAGHDESRCFLWRNVERHSVSWSDDVICRRPPVIRHWHKQSQAAWTVEWEGELVKWFLLVCRLILQGYLEHSVVSFLITWHIFQTTNDI